MIFTNKTVLLGVTGSIAAYKAADLASKLTQAGAKVDVVMTRAAREFIVPLTFRSITHRWVATDMFEDTPEFDIEHISLAERADIVVIAPATANIIAKIAAGIADDLLSCTVLATKASVILAPAMNVNMYQNPVTQENIARLRSRGIIIAEPGSGNLACGAVGSGRLADVEDILNIMSDTLALRCDLNGKHIVVTAGGTQEPIDPVRHIGNRSSGKMGYAIAEAARDRGAKVVLISAPTAVPVPADIEVIHVKTALQMKEAVIGIIPDADALIMAAAVADFRPVAISGRKIKKGTDNQRTLKLIRNPDILSEVKGKLIKVGFAAESEDLIKNATTKLKDKNLDLIVANDITAEDSGFDVDTNRVVLVDRRGKKEELPLMAKSEVAHKILDKVGKLLKKDKATKKK